MEEYPPFKYEDQPLSDELTASICNCLDIAGIPSVLWGEELMVVHGTPLAVEVSYHYFHIISRYILTPNHLN
jgi:hypothetical protein